MASRRRAREAALQVLYQIDVQPDLDADAALSRFYALYATDEDLEARPFTEQLVRGVVGEKAAIDQRLTDASRNWRLERMARVDRNLLRVAAYELGWCKDVPAKVAINEAIEIAKRFGAEETAAFVNGILDRVLAGMPERAQSEGE